MANVYFELTRAFNETQPTAALASGQAVVFYRIAIMSKDGDWVVHESADACERVLAVLEWHGARYRPGAPLDVQWLTGGWSSHFEFFDERGRRVRCDFVSRPPRVPPSSIDALFESARGTRLLTVDVESLILMKRTQRVKDYAVIGPLAALLPPERELELTTDPDRILTLAPQVGNESTRPAVRAALTADRRAIVVRLAEEADDLQQRDRRRVDAYQHAARRYLAECRIQEFGALPLREAHRRLRDAAQRLLPPQVTDANAQ